MHLATPMQEFAEPENLLADVGSAELSSNSEADWDHLLHEWTTFEASITDIMDDDWVIPPIEDSIMAQLETPPVTSMWSSPVPVNQSASLDEPFQFNDLDQFSFSLAETFGHSSYQPSGWPDSSLSTSSTLTASTETSLLSSPNPMPRTSRVPASDAHHTCESCGKSFPKRYLLK